MPIRVFLVEDSVLIRERLAEGLASGGEIEIVGYADTEAASIRALQDAVCDVVILDLNLKQGNGLTVLQSVRGRCPKPPPVIIVFTNFASSHYRKKSVEYGADYFFDKGRDYDRVRDVIERLASPGAAA